MHLIAAERFGDFVGRAGVFRLGGDFCFSAGEGVGGCCDGLRDERTEGSSQSDNSHKIFDASLSCYKPCR